MASYLIKWSNGEKRQEEEAAKPEEVINSHHSMQVSLSLSFEIHLAPFAARDQIFKAGNYGGSPVDETMSGNKFHCKNK